MQMNYMKKFYICLFIVLFLTFSLVSVSASNNLNIYSPSVLLIEASSGKILYEKNAYEKMYPASLTKVMTAILVLEKCNLSDVATVSNNAIMSIPSGYVIANIKEGEELTIEQLLYLLMVGSCNDAAVVLAEHISGSVEDFSILMNEKAKELGCTSTNFVNPNGLHNENHYSTAYDLALISKYAMNNEVFRTIAATTYYELPTTNKYKKEDRFFKTTNALISGEYFYKYATGMKTGFTTPARSCLISSANKDNLELICVVLGADLTPDGLSERYVDTTALFEYAFENYCMKEIISEGDIIQTVNIKNGTRNTKKLDLVVSNNINVFANKENKDLPNMPEIKIKDNLEAPIKKGEIIGTVTYTSEGIEYTENLLANSDVKKSYALITFLGLVFILLLCFLIIKSKKRQIKNKNKKLKNRIR